MEQIYSSLIDALAKNQIEAKWCDNHVEFIFAGLKFHVVKEDADGCMLRCSANILSTNENVHQWIQVLSFVDITYNSPTFVYDITQENGSLKIDAAIYHLFLLDPAIENKDRYIEIYVLPRISEKINLLFDIYKNNCDPSFDINSIEKGVRTDILEKSFLPSYYVIPKKKRERGLEIYADVIRQHKEENEEKEKSQMIISEDEEVNSGEKTDLTNEKINNEELEAILLQFEEKCNNEQRAHSLSVEKAKDKEKKQREQEAIQAEARKRVEMYRKEKGADEKDAIHNKYTLIAIAALIMFFISIFFFAQKDKSEGVDLKLELVTPIDLGLPSHTLWADRNCGAEQPFDFGEYVSLSDFNLVTKGWQIPTPEQFDELLSQCKWEVSSSNGIKGYKAVGPNGKSIFIPFAGIKNPNASFQNEYGYYWTNYSYYTKSYIYFFDIEERSQEYRNNEAAFSLRLVKKSN